MVATASVQQVKSDALSFFRESNLPARWTWIETLSPLHLRLFAVELADALKLAMMTDNELPLLELIDDWKATAELDATPEVAARVRGPKVRLPLDRFVSA